jgi:hypothetical protein
MLALWEKAGGQCIRGIQWSPSALEIQDFLQRLEKHVSGAETTEESNIPHDK